MTKLCLKIQYSQFKDKIRRASGSSFAGVIDISAVRGRRAAVDRGASISFLGIDRIVCR
jgi:hypothetical protein